MHTDVRRTPTVGGPAAPRCCPSPSFAPRGSGGAGSALLLAIAAVTASCVSGDTDPATDVTDQAATLRGHGSAGGQATQWWFKYGKTTGYGTETAHRSAGSGTNQQTVSERVTGLAPDTLYHYRICASNPSGSGCGKDLTLKTGSPGAAPGLPGDHGVQRARGSHRGALRARRANLRRREAGRDQGLRRPRRPHAHDGRQPASRGRPQLGSRAARPGARPGLPRSPLHLRALHLRRPDRRDRAHVERHVPHAARARRRTGA